MLKEMAFLWRNREKPESISRNFKVWGKRVFHLYGVCLLLVRPAIYGLRGARIGHLAILGKSRISGDVLNLTIGDESALGRCEISLHDRVRIGRCVVINDGAVLLTASHSVGSPLWSSKTAPISIGDYAWIATNAILLPGVNVGRGAVVGAGAVVGSDVPDYAVVTGNPAQVSEHSRARNLNYSPVFLNAPFEAWIGAWRSGADCNDVSTP